MERKIIWPEGPKPPSTLEEWRARIIRSVNGRGLRSASILRAERRLCMPSSDYDPFDSIEGRVFYPNDSNVVDGIKWGLYSDDYSILPVVAERFGEAAPLVSISNGGPRGAPEAEVQERLLACFLVVAKSLKTRVRSAGTRGKLILPQEFLYYVFPEEIYREYRQAETNGFRVPVKSVTKKLSRNVGQVSRQFVVWDFESAVSEILHEVDKPIWVHGVRLPTNGDLGRVPGSF